MEFKEYLEIPLKNLSLKEYLQESINSQDEVLCRGWDYLKQNLTTELKEILLNADYWRLRYNAEKEDYILNQLYTTDEINELSKEIVKQLGSFVYVWNEIKRDFEEKQKEQELKETLLTRGFKEQEETGTELKVLNGLKVICVLDISKIGILGSFDSKEEIKGTLTYSDYHNALMLIPQRCRTRGHIIRKKFYYKEIK